MTDLLTRLEAMLTPNADGLLPCECGGNVTMLRVGNDATAKRSITATCDSCRRSVTNAALRNGMEWLENVTRETLNRRPFLRALVEAVKTVPCDQDMHARHRVNECDRCALETKILAILEGKP